jgi:hypothetical protein
MVSDGSWRPDDQTDASQVTTNGVLLTDGEAALQAADINPKTSVKDSG